MTEEAITLLPALEQVINDKQADPEKAIADIKQLINDIPEDKRQETQELLIKMFKKKAEDGSFNDLKDLIGEETYEKNKEALSALETIYGGKRKEVEKDICKEIMDFLKKLLNCEGSCKDLMGFVKGVVSGQCCPRDKQLLLRLRDLIEGKESSSYDGLQCLKDLLEGKSTSGNDKQLLQILKELVGEKKTGSNRLQCFKDLFGCKSSSDDDKQTLQILKELVNEKKNASSNGLQCFKDIIGVKSNSDDEKNGSSNSLQCLRDLIDVRNNSNDDEQLLQVVKDLFKERSDCNRLKRLIKEGKELDNDKFGFWTCFTIHGYNVTYLRGDSSVISWVDCGFTFLKPSSKTSITAPAFCHVWSAIPLDPSLKLTYQYEVESTKTIHGSGLKVRVRPFINDCPCIHFPSHPIVVQIVSHEPW